MSKSNRRAIFVMVAVLLAAAFLRLVAWRDAPPGLRFDEMLVVTQTDAIRDGARPIYIDDLAEEALYHYLFAAAQDLFGEQLFTLRWLSLALGLIAIAALYALGRRMFNARVGGLAAMLAAASFWSLMYSRVGLRIIALPAFVTLAMLMLWRGLAQDLAGLRKPRRSYFVIAGGLFGLSAYTYSATRLLPAVFVAFGVYLFFFHRAAFRQQGRTLLLTLLLALIIALPMAIHIATVPAAERRLGEVEGPLDALQRGEVTPLIHSVLDTAGMFIARGDPEWLYNYPDRPVFDLVTGLIFYFALFVCARRWKQRPYALILIWLVAGLLPPMLTWPAASNSHGILAQSPAFLIAALGIDALATKLTGSVSFRAERGISGPAGGVTGRARDSSSQKHAPRNDTTTGELPPSRITPGDGDLGITQAQVMAVAFIGGVLIIHSAVSITDYFNRWATQPIVRAEHQAGVAQTARYLAQHPSDTALVFSSGSVTHWNPWAVTAFRLSAPIGYTNARWFDARSSFIFPQGQTDLTLITPALDDAPAPLDGRLIEDLFPIVESSPVATDYFSATHLVSSLNTRLITLTRASVSWPDGSAAQLPVAFADRLELIGYDVRRSAVEIGKNIRLTTYWRAQNPGRKPLSIFVHVLDEQGNIDAQWDGFTIAPEYVQRGDIIVQVHFIPIPPNFEAGTYQLALGLYLPKSANLPRVSIVSNRPAPVDQILLQSIQMINVQ